MVVTRFDFPSLAVRGYIDIPFMATVVWAGALEAAKPRRGTIGVRVARGGRADAPGSVAARRPLFPLDELGRELAGAPALCGADGDRPGALGATDFVVTGDPLFSLNSTQDLAEELRRQKSGSVVLEALPQFLRATVKTPVYFAGLAGVVIALWKFPLRFVIPGSCCCRRRAPSSRAASPAFR